MAPQQNLAVNSDFQQLPRRNRLSSKSMSRQQACDLAESWFNVIDDIGGFLPNYARVDPTILAMAEMSERGLTVDFDDYW